MTDRIDLDERDEPDDERADQPNRGDWLWREGGDPAEEPPSPRSEDGTVDSDGAGVGADSDADESADVGADASAGAGGEAAETGGGERETDEGGDRAIPHVPRPNKDRPVGIPVQGGGAGSGPGGGGGSAGPPGGGGDSAEPPGGGGDSTEPPGGAADGAGAGDSAAKHGGHVERTGEGRTGGRAGEGQATTGAASGPHGGGVDDMTMALTYRAVRRLADPARVVADAKAWADWVGIVGDVEAHVINKFQRDHQVDVDFFNGAGSGPAERLADVGPHSMFFAERMVVVGVEGEDEAIASEADWEFVSLSTAAEKADWTLSE